VGALGDLKILLGLEAHPDSGACSEVAGESRIAVSAETPRFPQTISLILRGGTPMSVATRYWLSSRGFRLPDLGGK